MKTSLLCCVGWLIVALMVQPVCGASRADDFNRGIAYLLLQDTELAKKNLQLYFDANPQATIAKGFSLLLSGDRWEAAKRFKEYLDTDYRSPVALTGISLALSGQGNSNPIEYLERTLRMSPSFSPAQMCLGVEWAKRRNFPAAEACFSRALKGADLPEYRMVTASVQLENGSPEKALSTLGTDGNRFLGNYHYYYLSTRALLDLGRTAEAAATLQRALASRPTAPEAQLLHARLLVQKGDAKRALSIAKGVKFPEYNLELNKTLARIHLEQKSGEAEKLLYEVFAQNRWDPDINVMLGQYHLRKKNPILQNWITRALLAGADARQVRALFPAEYDIPDYPFVPLFEVKRVAWLGSKWIVVFGRTASGGDEGVTLLDPVTLKPGRTLKYAGTFVDLLPGASSTRLLFATAPAAGETIAVYALTSSAKGGELASLTPSPLRMSSVLAALPAAGGPLYLTDGAISQIACESPFSLPGGGYRQSRPVFPRYPFAVYSVALNGRNVTTIRDPSRQRGVPIPELQGYYTVADAMAKKKEIADLVQKGQQLGITSTESVRIHFNPACPDAFAIQLLDLKNPLRGYAFDRRSGRLDSLDGTRLLGSNRYADLEWIAFDPDAAEVTVLTKDAARELYIFNYRTGIYKKIADKVMTVARNASAHTLYVISERANHLYFSETQLSIVTLTPFNNRKVTARRDLARFVDTGDPDQLLLSTCHGEQVRLDENQAFHTAGPSWEGAVMADSPDGQRTVCWINGRLIVLKGPANH